MDQPETLARVEKLTRAVLSSDDGGVPLHRFPSDYQRMTKTTFPWREYGFSSARDMLLSMENVVEFRFSDEENNFYLVPVHVAMNSNESSSIRVNETDRTERISSRIQHSSSNSNHSIASTDAMTEDTTRMPVLVETMSEQDDMFAFDHYGRVSVHVSQTKDKPVKGYWNKENLTKLFSPFGKIVDVSLMPNKKSGFVRYGTIEEARRAAQSMNGTTISGDGNTLMVRPGLTKQQKIGQPILSGQNNTSTKKQPISAQTVTTKPIVTKTIKKVAHEADSDDDDDDNVWDDGLLPRNNCCNGNHDNKGVVNGMTGLDLNDGSTAALREMFVSEVISPGLLWLKDAKLSGRDLQLLSLSIEMQQKQLKKLASWTLPKEGTAYCINVQEVNKDDKSGIRWSRVIVNKVLQNSEQVEIRHVDTGVLTTLSMSHLYVLPSSCQLREVPPAVIPCHLWGVASSHDNREWWPLDCQLLWSLIRNKKVFARLRSDVIHVFSDSIKYCIPVELFFDASGKDDIRDHLIKKGHFLVLTDAHSSNTRDDVNNNISTSDVKPATPSQEGVATMWRPSPRKANTDPLPQPHPITQTHNQSLQAASPSMWKPTKPTPTSLSFSEQ